MKRLISIFILIWTGLTSLSAEESTISKTVKPNIVFIHADDLGIECLKSYGGKHKTGTLISNTYAKMPSFGTYFEGKLDNQNVIWADGSGAKRYPNFMENVGSRWYAGKKN